MSDQIYSFNAENLGLTTVQACTTFFPGVTAVQFKDKISKVITLDDIRSVASFLSFTRLKRFLSLIVPDYSDDHPVNQNLAYVQYQLFNLTFCSRPALCLYKDQLNVLIGTESGDLKPTTVPLVSANGKLTLNGKAVSLDSYEYEQDGKKNKIPLLIISAGNSRNRNKTAEQSQGVDFTEVGFKAIAVSVKLQEGVDYFDFKEAFDDSDLDRLKMMVSPLFQDIANFSTIFSLLFEANIFPKDGIIFPIISNPISRTNTFNGKQLVSYQCRVDFSNLPPIHLLASTKDEQGNKSLTPVKAQSIGSLFANSNSTLGKYCAQNRNIEVTPENPIWVWVQGMSNNARHTPVHQVFNNSDFVTLGLRTLHEQTKAAIAVAAGEELNFDSNPI